MESLPFEIAETALAMRRAFDRRASATGVTRAQWRVLWRLDREPGLRQVELAERLDIEPITLCRIVDRLEEAGLIERRRDPDDRRAWRLELTAKAAPVIVQLNELGAGLQREAFAGLEEAELERIGRGLQQIRQNLGKAGQCEKAAS